MIPIFKRFNALLNFLRVRSSHDLGHLAATYDNKKSRPKAAL